MSEHLSHTSLHILVTGATGFIGRHVINTLIERGHSVIAMIHNKELLQDVHKKCLDVVYGDICNTSVLENLTHNIDVICHIAAYIPSRYDDPSEAERCYRINALATLSLASIAINKGIKRFVYTSTGNMYKWTQQPAIESDTIYPTDIAPFYFISKLAGEVYLNFISKTSNMDVLILRIGSPYGPGAPSKMVIPTFLKKARNGERLIVQNGGMSKYNFVYIDDVSSIIAKSLEYGDSGIYNISSSNSTSLRQLAEAVALVYSDRNVVVDIDSPTKDSFAGFPEMSIEKAIQTWQFSPLNIYDGLCRYKSVIDEEFISP